jgi:2-polyprenyl-3-methyl-5-hydroxy-6-metoxy-1,4-benzoquinol methylase
MTAQTWSSEGYAKNARFVTDLGTPVLELLAPRPGEHILDVGCGDGVLTKKIADLGCSVVGVDLRSCRKVPRTWTSARTSMQFSVTLLSTG